MAKIKEIIGHKFGKLTVLNTSETRGNRGQIRYDCICDCGNTHTVSGESITMSLFVGLWSIATNVPVLGDVQGK